MTGQPSVLSDDDIRGRERGNRGDAGIASAGAFGRRSAPDPHSHFGRGLTYDTNFMLTHPDPKLKRWCWCSCSTVRSEFLRCCRRVLQSGLFTMLMTVLTLFVLVGDDIRLACFEKPQDDYFNWINIVCLCLFMLEILFSSLVKEDYFLGFWFVADLFASLSLIFDLTYVSEAMMGYPTISFDNLKDNQDAGAVENTEYARAARSGRVGTRVARLLRVVRLMRLSRIIRAFQWFLLTTTCGRYGHGDGMARRFAAPGESAEPGTRQAESRVGRKLSERTTQRVIILVLGMLVIVPQLTPGEPHTMVPDSAQYGADVILQAWQDLELVYASNSSAPKVLERRLDWEMQVLTYIYYHNWHSACSEEDIAGECSDFYMHKLCWVGHVETDTEHVGHQGLSLAADGYIQAIQALNTSWEERFNSTGYKFEFGSLPEDIQGNLSAPWSVNCTEPDSASRIRGVSLMPGDPCPRLTLRKQETVWYTPIINRRDFFEQHMEAQFVFVYDIREVVVWEAFLGVAQTVFVVVVLAIGALLFSRDVDKLVLLPIERMISKVETIRKDPLYAISLGSQQMKGEAERRISKRTSSRGKGGRPKQNKRKDLQKATLETKILENAIIKLGSLLALGFGEAGSEIIGQNMDDENGTVNAMIPGSKVEAIYGFCAIRDFAAVTEVLREKTMVFVNQVAEIVHRIVDEHLGAANKNVGEAFLLVWRIDSASKDESMRPKTAGLAVLSFVKVVAELGRDWQLAEYRTHPALVARLPNFRVSLGFGLHLGWSIVGAIGSEFKIDASYLSPHVNVAIRLEAATSEYGVRLLLSEPLVRSCDEKLSRHFRPIDHVKLQGSKIATRLFTVDLNPEVLPVESESTARRRRLMNRAQERAEREQRKDAIKQDQFQVHEIFNTDKSIRRMRDIFLLHFFREFEKGYLNYEAGEWDVAAKVLGRTAGMLEVEDGPSRTLLEYMRCFDFQAPIGWPGWRELRER